MSTIYYQGPGDILMRATVGQGATTVGNESTSSSPVAIPGVPRIFPNDPPSPDIIFFRGLNNGLFQINSDGSGVTLLGTKAVSSTPFVISDTNGIRIYFQAADNSLNTISFGPTGPEATQIAGQRTASSPFAVASAGGPPDRIYFQGTNNALLMIPSNANNVNDVVQVGGQSTSSTPFVISGANAQPDRVYFRGTDNTLWAIDGNGQNPQQIITGWDSTPNKTSSTPFVVPGNNMPDLYQGVFKLDRVYFRGTDNKLWVVDWDWGNTINQSQHQINNNSTSSSPFVTSDLTLYFQGTNDVLWVIEKDGTQVDHGYRTTSSPFAIQ